MARAAAASAPDFRSVRLGLRAPRAVITFDGGPGWEARAALALYAAAQVWGGSGFILVPEDAGTVSPAILRAVPFYDPDYVLGLCYAADETEAIKPRKSTDYPVKISSNNGNLIAAGQSKAILMASSAYRRDAGGEIVCPADWISHALIRSPFLTSWEEFPLPQRPAVLAAPAGVGGTLGLALAMRCGFAARPELPFAEPGAQSGTGDLAAMAQFSMLGPALDTAPPGLVDFLGGAAGSVAPQDQPPAWADTEAGLALVQRASTRPRPKYLLVVGSGSADFALALAWDRMFKHAVWLPEAWLTTQPYEQAVRKALFQLTAHSNAGAYELVVTSASMDEAQVRTALGPVWPPMPEPEPGTAAGAPAAAGTGIRFESPVAISLRDPLYLACSPEDYDISLALPTVNDGHGGFSFAAEVPVYTPGSDALRGPPRPFWQVDVEVSDAAVPPGRGIPGHVLCAVSGPARADWVRSSHSGVSFVAHSMGFVPGSASLRQAVARPRLRYPGMVDWVTEIARAQVPPVGVENSAAGYRAHILAQLWGGRARLASDIWQLGDLFREFKASSQKASEAYPDQDGVPLVGGDGILTFRAAMRVLGGLMPESEVRSHLDRLLDLSVVRRGLALACAECDRLAFIAVDALGQSNVCARCGASSPLTQSRWRHPFAEPEWFYDLHGAVREMLADNGDVPLLAARYLGAGSAIFADVPELDFRYPVGKPKEIDLVALADGAVIVGEAKKNASLGQAPDRKAAVTKLITIAGMLRSDQLLLCTTEPEAWNTSDTGLLRQAVVDHAWVDGRQPSLRVITGLGTPDLKDERLPV